MKYELAIFDMDGTILDTLTDVTNCINYALEKNNCPRRSVDDLRMMIGFGARTIMQKAATQGISEDAIDQIYKDFCDYYEYHSMDTTRPYTGIMELIKELRLNGVKTAIVSNKPDPAVLDLCDNMFPEMFDVVFGTRPGIDIKPAPDLINLAIDSLNIKRDKCVYIGDTEIDIEAAKNADIDCIAVTYGFRDEEYLKSSGAKIIAKTPFEILDVMGVSAPARRL